jgi:hypothetical protein
MTVDIELRKAAAYISAGKSEAAHTILSEYLKDFPDSDLAWLLFSYVVEDLRKQLASVSRALRLNPGNDRARDRHDQLMQQASGQSPRKQTPGEESSFDWPKIYDDQFDGIVQNARPMSIDDRLAFVTLEADSTQGYLNSDYPTDSFLDDGQLGQGESRSIGKGRSFRPKQLILGGASVLVLIALVVIAIKYFTGGFISKEDAQATASVETAVALATKEAKGRLPATWTATVTPTVTHTSTPTCTPTPTASPTHELVNPTVAAEIENLQLQVSGLRELPILEDVNTNLIMRSKVRSLLEEYYNSIEGSQEQIEDSSTVLVALGLMDPNYDLLSNILSSLTDGVGGFYLHESNQIYVIGYRFAAIEKFIYAHEFDHALIDQHFNLAEINVYPRCEGDEDRCRAIQALVEGDAILLMTQWLTQVSTAAEYDKIMRYDPTTRILVEQNPPPFAVRNSQFPYVEGLTFVEFLYARDGWNSVNQAFSRLPASTEQILHPDKYLGGEAPLSVSSVRLDGVLGDEWRLVRENTLGEWMTYLLLGYSVNQGAQVGDTLAIQASEGWGGDRYQVYRNNDTGEIVLVVHWKWDSSGDADQFFDVMKNHLEGRFSAGEVVGANVRCWEGDHQVSCLYSADRESLWIVAPRMDLLRSLESQFPAFR